MRHAPHAQVPHDAKQMLWAEARLLLANMMGRGMKTHLSPALADSASVFLCL